jgi:prepilin signal peptidase PulO-like enzyme (type II secretory pathway)
MRQEDNEMLTDIRRRLKAPADDGPKQEATPVLRRLGLLLAGSSWQTRGFAALAAGLIVGAGIRFLDPGVVVVVAVYIVVLVICAATDLAWYRVPNVITYPAIILAFLAGSFMPDGDLLRTLGGAGTAAGFMLLALIISRGAMGLGDVKLALFSGLAVGWPLVGDMLVLMALTGGVVAVILLLTRVKGRRDPIPYAPFISAATIAVIFWQGTSFTRF